MKNTKLTALLINVGIFALANQPLSAKTPLAEDGVDEEIVHLKSPLPQTNNDQSILFEEVKDKFKNNDEIKRDHCCVGNTSCRPDRGCL